MDRRARVTLSRDRASNDCRESVTPEKRPSYENIAIAKDISLPELSPSNQRMKVCAILACCSTSVEYVQRIVGVHVNAVLGSIPARLLLPVQVFGEQGGLRLVRPLVEDHGSLGCVGQLQSLLQYRLVSGQT